MFTVGERDELRDRMIERARIDVLVTACALLGSAARDEEDAWSDIDLALQVGEGVALDKAAASWSTWLGGTVDVVDRLDVPASGALYRVFLLRSSLQIDLSFWPAGRLRAVGDSFRLVFGKAGASEPAAGPDPSALIRRGWLYAVHARSALARGRTWQAEMMLADLRNQVVALACLRHGLEPLQGRGAHGLPADLLSRLAAARSPGLGLDELRRSFEAAVELLRSEVPLHGHDPHGELDRALIVLSDSLSKA